LLACSGEDVDCTSCRRNERFTRERFQLLRGRLLFVIQRLT